MRPDLPVTLPVRPPVAPMLAKLSRDLPGDAGLFYEPKWDGFRCIVYRDGDDVELGSRNEKPLTRYFPELVEALRRELPGRCVLDGEIVIAGPKGLDFDALSQRIHPAEKRIRLLAESTPASFVAFDLLAHDDRSYMDTPYAKRRAALEKLLAKARPPVHLTPVTDDPDVANDWFSRFEGAGLDGVVVKAGDLHYLPDKRAMVKVKHQRTADCVVAGLPHPQGRGRRGLHPARPLRRRGDPAPRGRGLRLQRGPPPRAGGRARAVPRGRAEGPPLGGVGRGAGGGQGSRRHNRWNAGKDMTWEPVRAERGVRGVLRPPPGEPLPPRNVVRALAPRPRPGLVHLRAAGHPGPLRAGEGLRDRVSAALGDGALGRAVGRDRAITSAKPSSRHSTSSSWSGTAVVSTVTPTQHEPL